MIEHDGVIESIDGQHIVVKVLQTSACSMCKASSFCQSNENKEKLIDIYLTKTNLHNRQYEVGQDVVVCTTEKIGKMALLYGFVLPLVVLLVVLLLAMHITGDEAMACIMSIISLMPYYLILYMLKGRIKKQFKFFIIPKF